MNQEYRQAIINYYDNTRLDYWVLWFSKNNRSVHFGYYDEEIQTHSEALLNLNKVLAEKAGIVEGDTILDAGCGQGGSAIWLVKNFNVHVEGITLVPHQVEKANRFARKNKIEDKVAFTVQDYTQTNFPDETFSVIWACESVCHAMHKADFYKEAFRILKPGGRIVCVDYIRKERPLSNTGEKLLHDWLDGWSIMDIDTKKEHETNAYNVGFSEIEIEDITMFTRPSLRHLHSMASKLWGFGKFLRLLGFRNDVNHGNHFGSIKQYEALENDLWYYGLLTIKKK